MIEIEGNKELFEECKRIGTKIKLSLPAIVQNDMKLSEEQIDEWDEEVSRTINDLLDWKMEVQKHINKNKKENDN